MEKEEILSAVISVMFINGDPLPVSKIASLLGVEKEKVEHALENVESIAIPGLKIIQLDGKYQLATDSRNAEFIKKLTKDQTENILGKGSLEVLAVVLYQGPVTKDEVELIRGINSSQSIRNLLIRGLIEENDNDGVVRYVPTVRAFHALGIQKAEDLPDYQALRNNEKTKEYLNRLEKEMVDGKQE